MILTEKTVYQFRCKIRNKIRVDAKQRPSFYLCALVQYSFFYTELGQTKSLFQLFAGTVKRLNGDDQYNSIVSLRVSWVDLGAFRPNRVIKGSGIRTSGTDVVDN